jgi:hypothetical protein
MGHYCVNINLIEHLIEVDHYFYRYVGLRVAMLVTLSGLRGKRVTKTIFDFFDPHHQENVVAVVV